MRSIPPSLVFASERLPRLMLGVLVCGFMASRAFAGDTPTPETSGSDNTGNPLLHSLTVTAAPGDTGADLVALVGSQAGGKEVTVKDIRDEIETLDPSEQAALAANPAVLKRVVYSLLLEPMIIKEIKGKKWDQSPEVQARLARLQQTALVNLYLKSVAEPPPDYPSDAELKSAYEARKNALMVPHSYRISQIFIALAANADKATSEKARAKLDSVISALKQPDADYSAIAKAQSDDAKSAAQGGDMGWWAYDKMVPAIRVEAMLLPRNTPSRPVRLQDGWHIIKVTDAKDPAPVAFDDVKAGLAQRLRAEKRTANLQAFYDRLAKQNPITIDDKVLPEVIKPGN